RWADPVRGASSTGLNRTIPGRDIRGPVPAMPMRCSTPFADFLAPGAENQRPDTTILQTTIGCNFTIGSKVVRTSRLMSPVEESMTALAACVADRRVRPKNGQGRRDAGVPSALQAGRWGGRWDVIEPDSSGRRVQ